MNLVPHHVFEGILSLHAHTGEYSYHDRYDNQTKYITDPAAKTWNVDINGVRTTVDFGSLESDLARLFQLFAMWGLQRFAPATVYGNLSDLIKMSRICKIACFAPVIMSRNEFTRAWTHEIRPIFDRHRTSVRSLKMWYRFLSQSGQVSVDYDFDRLLRDLPHAESVGYQSVLSGRFRMSGEDERNIIHHLDESARHPEHYDVIESCILIATYTHGMRPIQQAKLTVPDLTVVEISSKTDVHVKLRYHSEKQRTPGLSKGLVRSVRREWCNIFIALRELRASAAFRIHDGAVPNSLLGLNPQEISELIKAATQRITGRSISATNLRHAAAQRLVDSGASHAEVTEFLGHSSLRTANIYFSHSPMQAERLNAALGSSPIYTKVKRRWVTITVDELRKASADSQVGGTVHGTPISGIGGCRIGQSRCTLNPVFSCYGCFQFIPANDLRVHLEVRETLVPIIRDFFETSERGVGSSFGQLRHTMEALGEVIDYLRNREAGS
ncbi:tyrosine-type recombinase/integrase [Aliihoeflea sp. 2WW]|uniref:tyrosine-type recombinase/integrase n=1 Tax=Aliihoeflea sp. 2WW TaxID=1381123 RepID=UPI0004BC8A06|nr:tyrosine-type recombinase/integrase [Aliihoeflea sp. 2WW]